MAKKIARKIAVVSENRAAKTLAITPAQKSALTRKTNQQNAAKVVAQLAVEKAAAEAAQQAAYEALSPAQRAAIRKRQKLANGLTVQQAAALKAAQTRRERKLATTPAVAAAIAPEVVRGAPITATESVDLNKLESALKLAKMLMDSGLI